MSVETFIPELWDAAIKEPYQKALVYGQPSVASNAWMGQISNVGDTVHISALTAPTVKDYVRGQGISIDDVDVSTTTLNIDQGKYFAFRVNDVDKVQTAGDFQGPATAAAGTQLRDHADQYLAKVLKDGALAANKLGTVQVVNDDPAKAGSDSTGFKVLVQLSEKLNRQSVPTTGRYAIIGPKTYSALLMDPRFTRVDASGTSEGLRNAIVGRAVGFDILLSNNVPSTSGRELATAGVADAFAFADQILQTEAHRDHNDFGDIVRGLHVFGAAVTRPEGVATADIDVVDPSGATEPVA